MGRIVLRNLVCSVLLFTTVTALAADGDFDPSFGTSGILTLGVAANTIVMPVGPVIQADGKILACGADTADDGTVQTYLYRLNPDGSPDPAFGDSGRVNAQMDGFINLSTSYSCVRPVPRSDGKILVVGLGLASDQAEFPEMQAVLLESDGTQDEDFGIAGTAHLNVSGDGPLYPGGFLVQPDDAIVFGVADDTTELTVKRLHPDGSVDASFGVDGAVTVSFPGTSFAILSIASLDAAGRILLAGFTVPDGASRRFFAAARLLPNGTLDTTFGTGGFVAIDVARLDGTLILALVQPDGHIILAGTAYDVIPGPVWPGYVTAVRLLDDGTLDASFGDGGMTFVRIDPVENLNPQIWSGLIRPDGKIMLVGSVLETFPTSQALIVLLDRDGNVDTGFGTDGVRLFDIKPGPLMQQTFTGIAQQGSNYLVFGNAVAVPAEPTVGGSVDNLFAVRLEGQTSQEQPSQGHSAHARPPIRTADRAMR
jgi:uncharacterized delta-60 repeat protein